MGVVGEKMKKIVIGLVWLLGSIFPACGHSEVNTMMMESTFRIYGSNGKTGTVFFIGKPDGTGKNKAVMVTAGHVLADMPGDEATIVFRKRGSDGQWTRFEQSIHIRQMGHPLWKVHPEADVAGMLLPLPQGITLSGAGVDWLVSDYVIQQYGIHPGMDLSCLGFPFGAEANAAGFPILRSGKIASYPLIPTAKTKTFLFDFSVFGGNSGGPVFYEIKNPELNGSTNIGSSVSGIMGLVIESYDITEKMSSTFETSEKRTPLRLAVVVHASYIRQLVDSL
jgi:hypothetical protein